MADTEIVGASEELPAAPVTMVRGGDQTPAESGLAMPRGLSRIGRYHVLKSIGEGGMGVVYSAFDEELDRRIAIKVLAADIATEFRGRTRIMREAQAMAKLSHPNVVHVYEVGDVGGHVYVAMEYVRGVTLREWLDTSDHPLRERVDVVIQAGEGLAAAHAAGIIHRDFKPENVMVATDGRARVLDFGLARGEEEGHAERTTGDTLNAQLPERQGSVLSVQVTQHGSIMGTPAYMSPEQHFGLPTDARSDQYNFCVVLYEALYGERPIAGENRMAIAFAARQEHLQPPPAGTDVPARLREILVRGLKADPPARWESMRELLDALRVAASPAPPTRSPWLAVGIAAAVVLAIVLALLLGRGEPPTSPPSAVEGLAASARLWASRAHWVYPDPNAPDETALRAVTDLRALAGDLDAPGEAGADELSREFADTLARLGDQYWDADGGRLFARDFYAQALLFDPALARARERSGVLPGELADLRERAERGGFSPEELAAAQELAELAAPLLEAPDVEMPAETIAAKVETVRKRASKRRATSSHLGAESTVADASAMARGPAAATSEAEAPVAEPLAEPSSEVPVPDPVAEATAQPGDAPVPADPAAQRELAKSLVQEAKRLKKQGKRDAALKKMFEATRADRRYAPAWDGLRDLHFQRGAYEEAAQYGEKALKLAPGNGQYHLRVGEAYWKLRELDAAERAWKTAQSLGVEQANDRLEALRKAQGR